MLLISAGARRCERPRTGLTPSTERPSCPRLPTLHTTPTPAPDVARTKRAARGTKTPRNTRPAVQAPPAKSAAAPFPDDALARMLWLASETDEWVAAARPDEQGYVRRHFCAAGAARRPPCQTLLLGPLLRRDGEGRPQRQGWDRVAVQLPRANAGRYQPGPQAGSPPLLERDAG